MADGNGSHLDPDIVRRFHFTARWSTADVPQVKFR